MTPAQLTAAESMHSALNMLPCRCEHNVPYAGMKVEQVVTKQCARCSSMAAWRLAVGEPSRRYDEFGLPTPTRYPPMPPAGREA